MGLSSFASKPVEEVVAANPQTFFQLYWSGTREHIRQRMERARVRGTSPISACRTWLYRGSPPRRSSQPTASGCRPRRRNGTTSTGCAASGTAHLLLKGVTRVDDAKRAVAAGVDAISVSNHGGNDLDSTPATIRCLPAVVDAVGDQIEVLLDGGVRRGGDVVKALALGARAIMIGRAYLWGLAANGQAGVENVLDIMRCGIDSALLGLGRSSVHDLSRGDLVIQPSFARTLAA
jgi:pre-mycofactocin synthase